MLSRFKQLAVHADSPQILRANTISPSYKHKVADGEEEAIEEFAYLLQSVKILADAVKVPCLPQSVIQSLNNALDNAKVLLFEVWI
jgi:hypothetical protein